MVDRAASSVGFAVSRATTGHVGRFGAFDARLELDEGRPINLEVAVETGSVVADRAGLTQHLKSADFFDVGQFPTSTFTSERITPAPDVGPDAYTIEGKLRLHGVEGALKMPATIAQTPEHVRAQANLDISAKAFGIDYEGMEAELAEDAVSLEIVLVFPRVAAPTP